MDFYLQRNIMVQNHSRGRGSGLNSVFQVVLAFAMILLSGCGMSRNAALSTNQFIGSVVSSLDNATDQRVQGLASESDTFLDLCLKRALGGEEIRMLLVEVNNSFLDIEAAKSAVWPRIGLGGSVAFPLDGSSNQYDIGLIMKFDVWSVLFANEQAAYKAALYYRNRISLQLALSNIVWDTYLGIERDQLLTFKTDAQQSLAEDAAEGARLAQLYCNAGKADIRLLHKWQALEETNKAGVLALRLDSLAPGGKPGYPSIREYSLPADFNQVTEAAENIPIPPASPSAVWKSRLDGQLVTIELLAAETALRLGDIKRLPQFHISTGVGRFLINDNKDVPGIVRLGIDYPILDFGDHRRDMSKIRAGRDMFKEKAKRIAASMWEDALTADKGTRLSSESLREAQKAVTRASMIMEDGSKLLAAGRIDSLEYITMRMELKRMEMAQREALNKHRQTVVAAHRAWGVPLIPGLVEELAGKILHSRLGMPEEQSRDIGGYERQP